MKGFTLIELLVTMGLVLLASGGAIVNYNNFNENQKIKQGALTLKNNLRLIQNKAQSGQKPFGVACTTLRGYQVTFNSSSRSYSWQAVCDPQGNVGETALASLPSGVIFESVPASLTYRVLTQGTDSDAIITLKGMGKRFSLAISRGGDITELGFE